MTVGSDIFGPGSNFKRRFIESYDELAQVSDSLKKIGVKVVLVMGTYDLTHIGHARYLEMAKQPNSIVIIGVDPDKSVQLRKGPNRPLVPEQERLEMLAHLRHVDLVTLASDFDEKGIGGYNLIEKVRPDVFVISEMNHYTPEQMIAIKQFCKEVIIFPQQAETTTSAKLRLMNIKLVKEAQNRLEDLVNL